MFSGRSSGKRMGQPPDCPGVLRIDFRNDGGGRSVGLRVSSFFGSSFRHKASWRAIVLCLAAALGVLCGGNRPAVAAEDSVQVSRITIGLDNSFKLGRWSAIEFDLTGPAGTTVVPVLLAADPDGRSTGQPLPAVRLNGDTPVLVRGLFRAGKLNAPLQLQLTSENQVLSTTLLRTGAGGGYRPLKQSTSVWLTVSSQPVFERGLDQWNSRVPGSAYVIALVDFSHPVWSGQMLDGIDVVVMSGDVAVDDETSAALRDWVQQGGRLIIGIGSAVEQLAASPLAEWLPQVPEDRIDVAKLNGLQDLVPRSSQLRTLTTIPAARLNRQEGVVLAPGLAGPLAVRSACGAGQVTLVAVRLDEPPLATWQVESQSQFTGVLAGWPLPWNQPSAGAARDGADFDPSAVTDLQSQLNQSLDHFDGISRAAPWTIIGWIALFAVIIGPLDYFLVRHWLGRPEWTWLTMLGWVLVASGLAIARGNSLNDHPATSRQIDSLDVDLTTDRVYGWSWYNFYSQLNQRQKVQATLNPEFFPSASPTSMNISWVARPGEGYRGMSGSGGLDDTQPGYRFFEDRMGIENFPVRKWSTAAVSGQWETAVPAATLVSASLQEGGPNRMSGTIEHHLPGELTDWFLAYGNFAYFERAPVGEHSQPLAPGRKWNVGEAASNLLRGRLLNMIQEQRTGRPSTAVDDQLQRIAYDPDRTDALTCELVTSFYQTLGGEGYTGLRNESLRRLDLSETIQLKRAVLFGRLTLPPVQFQLDGRQLPAQEQSVMVRLILPVQELIRDPDAPPPKEILQLPR